jgi:RimJ/RimL family protein N-acetyltransferase
MITDLWPLFGLRLRTPRLELRVPGLEELAALGQLAADGVHDPAVMPFVVPWTDADPLARARGTMQWHWSQWGEWSAQRWSLGFVAVLSEAENGPANGPMSGPANGPANGTMSGSVIGTQDIGAEDFAQLREVGSGSWLGLAHHGHGYGTEMRAAVLELAFTGLGAAYATSAAMEDNHASYAVSRKLGYADDGISRHAIRGQAAVSRRVRLNRESWAAHRTIPVTIEGLHPCLPMFGLPPG